ncbi:type I-E CRISPR-associated protein Cse2/CasB [Streptomyces sp. RFCAC02]|uniref:type I-E CRISPR-associated protein Cse2/CasB n=1 Tax=Streptomyces sp. RFCAC02 TaxID=2499143 RepID=UPI00101FBD9E|nr:type I-E CRISPR-associated protein Cse2/CasB [Streptomyces sp. RFCAC02]
MTTTDEATVASAGHGTSSPPRDERLKPYDTFVDQVLAACREPGTQQALRQGLAKPVNEVPARTHAALLRAGLVPENARGAKRRAYYAVAALIAARPRAMRETDARETESAPESGTEPTGATPPPSATGTPDVKTSWGSSLGACLAQAVTREGADQAKEAGVESRLHLLVRQDIDGLHRMLPAVVRQMSSSGVPVDYGRLLYDIAAWPYTRGRTTTRWLEDYYRTIRRSQQSS